MSEPKHWPALIAGGWQALSFKPFREGIDAAWLLRSTSVDNPLEMAVLRYAAGAGVPKHRHQGTETILVLEGAQSDEGGTYSTGTCVINPKDSEHWVYSEYGCVVLVQWAEPVLFLD